MFHLLYDGTVVDARDYAAIGGDAEAVRERLAATWSAGLDRSAAVHVGLNALVDPTARYRRQNLKSLSCRAVMAAGALVELTPRTGRHPRLTLVIPVCAHSGDGSNLVPHYAPGNMSPGHVDLHPLWERLAGSEPPFAYMSVAHRYSSTRSGPTQVEPPFVTGWLAVRMCEAKTWP